TPETFTPTWELEEEIFEITNHWNKGIALLSDLTSRKRLSFLNLHACRKSKKSLAYKEALYYAQTGVQLCESDSWTTQYELTLALYLELHECLFLTTDFEKANQTFDLIIQNVKKKTDAKESYFIKISQDTMQGKYTDAVQAGFDILAELGINLSEDKIMEVMQNEASLVQTNLAGKNTSELSKLEMSNSPDIILISKILSVMMPTAFFSNPFLNFLIVLKTINMALMHGVCGTMAFSLACTSLPFVALFNDYKRGFDFGLFAIELAKKCNDVYSLGNSMHVFALFTQHWKDHLHKNISVAKQAFAHLQECGDMQMAGYTFFDVLDSSYGSGVYLNSFMEEIKIALNYLEKTKNYHAHSSLIVYKQLALYLQNQTKSTDSFDTEEFSEQEHLNRITGNMMACVYYHIYKLNALYMGGYYKLAHYHSEEAEKMLPFITAFYPTALWNFYSSLNNCKLVELSESQEQKDNLIAKIIQNQKQMKMWAENAPMNFQHKYNLVQAELSCLTKKFWKSAQYYEIAIKKSNQSNFLSETALAYELAGIYYSSQKFSEIATQYLTKAKDAYQKWGATAKVDQIQKKYSSYLAHQMNRMESTIATTTSKTMTVEYMDISSILKATQSISSEIVIEKLLRKLMQTVLENAGAELGYLLLPKDGNWYIEVEGRAGRAEIQKYEKPIEEMKKVSLTILNYVIHSQEPVVLSNAMQEGQFTNDPFIISQESKSVLCTPLLNQSKLIGVLYLENKFTIGAFTPSRLAILNVLAAQAAISLENAAFYETLEQKVETRTLELSKANNQLTEANEIAEQEKAKSEKLLLNILPEEVAKELKENGLVKPVYYESVSVMFTDLKGFTKVAETMSVENLVKELDASFYYFDDIITKYNLEKIKTIGDSYMCAGGLPKVNNTHIIDTCLAAIEIQRVMEQAKEIKKTLNLPYWELRIGIHTGPVIAGVVGKKKFAYDIWGDTVNIASRMESSGEPNKINISKEVYEQVKAFFDCEYRGKVKAKNKGDIDMYFLGELKTEYSMSEEKKTPNDLFWEMYNKQSL
ncbi:MAG TPA: adenylate/guanylate cyclase domain-containing protein, partial [Leptospiraceae bacterium]|nr:adenylate/guanylate cyclase domain-containing protein [Leptospiraceae bacterium]